MKGIDRIGHYFETEKQKKFDRDFLSGWELFDTWDEVEVGRVYQAPHDYLVKAEDIIYYNRAIEEADPLMIDEMAASAHSPTGHVIAHPIFFLAMLFYCLGKEGPGTWLRTPGSRNPFQDIELFEPIYVGERISLTFKTVDRFIRRDKHYITNQGNFTANGSILKLRANITLILPPTRDDIRRFVTA